MIRAEEVPMKRFLCWVLLALLPACAAAAYPEKPITMIIAYPPGGGTD
ncbi:MAG: tripartite tricarboxylate transporter substrate binding protein, partial [Betaproteobacteria bacterium]